MLLRDEITVDKEVGEGDGKSCQHRAIGNATIRKRLEKRNDW